VAALPAELDPGDSPLVRLATETSIQAEWGLGPALTAALLAEAPVLLGRPHALAVGNLPSPASCRRQRVLLADRAHRPALWVGSLFACGRRLAFGRLVDREEIRA
jgi:hypothetical protein